LKSNGESNDNQKYRTTSDNREPIAKAGSTSALQATIQAMNIEKEAQDISFFTCRLAIQSDSSDIICQPHSTS
jgi:hypothetical protein